MNQLLITNLKQNTADFLTIYEPSIPYMPVEAKISKGRFIFFRIQFFIFIMLIFSISLFYYTYTSSQDKNEKLSANVLSNYSLSNMYNNDSAVISIGDDSNTNNILGVLSIPIIDLTYPIFNDCTKELLKISPCRFSGPSPSTSGNLTIAGHNYDNGTFFSDLYKLSNDDIIRFTDQFGVLHTYSVFHIYEVDADDLTPVETSTYDYELTLITCNNINNRRIIIKAKKQDF